MKFCNYLLQEVFPKIGTNLIQEREKLCLVALNISYCRACCGVADNYYAVIEGIYNKCSCDAPKSDLIMNIMGHYDDLFKMVCEDFMNKITNHYAIVLKTIKLRCFDLFKYVIESYECNVHENIVDMINCAAIYGCLDIIKYLIEKYECVYHKSCMHYALVHGHMIIVKYLAEHFGCCTLENPYKTFSLSAKKGNLESLKYIDKNHDIDRTTVDSDILVIACYRGHLDVVMYIEREFNCGLGNKAAEVFKIAMTNGHLNLAKYICGRYSFVLLDDGLLIQAASKNRLDCVKYLMSLGIKIDDMAFSSIVRYSRDIIKCFVSRGYWNECLDPYKFIGELCPEHLEKISDQRIKKIITTRYSRKFVGYKDIIIMFDE